MTRAPRLRLLTILATTALLLSAAPKPGAERESAGQRRRERAQDSDYPPFTRGVLVHSQASLDPDALRMVRKYARWVYVTDGVSKPNDPKFANPWDRLSKHLEAVCRQLADE